MRRALLWLTVLAMAPGLSAARSDGQEATEDARVRPFLARLQGAVARGDRQAVAAEVQYPLTVFVQGLRMPVEDAAAFVERYDQIMTPDVRTAIAAARMPSGGTPARGLRIAADGAVRIGDCISVDPVGESIRIVAITVKVAAPAAAAPGGGGGGRVAARRLSFRVGRPTQASGALAPKQTDRYVAQVGQGTLLDVRVDRVRGTDVVARVVDAKTGKPIDARAGAGARVWTGRVPATAEYRIEVVRRGGDADLMPYVLTVQLK